MSNLTLYRKYRPKNFEEVLGQDDIVEILKKSIENDNFSHAYLFFGGRGTGKTSIARIFANEIKIHKNDIYEIDAASNRGIDDIRGIYHDRDDDCDQAFQQASRLTVQSASQKHIRNS